MIVFALGVAAIRFLVPSVYAVALGCTIPATVFVLVTLHPGNLSGLAFLATVPPGLVVGLAVGIIGSALHKSTFPGWMPYAFMGCGVRNLSVAILRDNDFNETQTCPLRLVRDANRCGLLRH
jgi:hypothetical protein